VRLATALGALALGAGGLTVTTLARPTFPGPAGAPNGPHRLLLVSSRYDAPSSTAPTVCSRCPTNYLAEPFHGLHVQGVFETANRVFLVYGKDGASGRYLVATDRAANGLYAFDFASYAWPPRIKPGDRDFVYEQPVWAEETGGVLYVETAHSTYARSSYGQNAYITAIDRKTRKALWRSPALVANANTFLVSGRYLITGYGFTDEPDYLYLLDRSTGSVVDRLLLPTGPEKITWQGKLIHVRTYDHNVLVRLRGA
jgi:hypothetical protein